LYSEKMSANIRKIIRIGVAVAGKYANFAKDYHL
jgi:hypothetical protein